MSDKYKCISTEDAISILQAQGYTITPPAPPLSGKVYIYMDRNGNVYTQGRRQYKIDKLIAVVPWTEGQGLTENCDGENYYTNPPD